MSHDSCASWRVVSSRPLRACVARACVRAELVSPTNLTLTALGAPPVARLGGSSGDLASTGVITLDASESFDPDLSAGSKGAPSSSSGSLAFSWACEREDNAALPCFSGAEQGNRTVDARWTLPASLLAADVGHRFSVTVRKTVAEGAEPLAATASVRVK